MTQDAITPRAGLTEIQEKILRFIESEMESGRPAPNTVEIKNAGITSSFGHVARSLDAIEKAGYIVRLYQKKRGIRLCNPSIRHASTDQLVAELEARGFKVIGWDRPVKS